MGTGSRTITQNTVAVAMSGGVDSSVAAALLVKAGYHVVGFTMKLWDAENDGYAPKVCCTAAMARDAGSVCRILDIPHYTLDLRVQFQREVVDQFTAEYLCGATPNPCVRCNSLIKWGRLWEKAQALGLERLATGHYAKVEIDHNGNPHLLRGLDLAKDQSYFLWQIPSDMLKVTIFPLAHLIKPEVRRIAAELSLPVADKAESQEICFIPDDDYRAWLLNRNPELNENSISGEMVDVSGKVLGKHEGCHQFTIGQRKGLGLGGGRKIFVTDIDPVSKRVTLGDEDQLERSQFKIRDINILDGDLFDDNIDKIVKVRYRDAGVVATVTRRGDEVIVSTLKPVKAVAPGQSAVFYAGDRLLGGGVIVRS